MIDQQPTKTKPTGYRQLDVLNALQRHDGEVGRYNLSSRSGVPSNALSETIGRLEELGLVSRNATKSMIRLTDHGRLWCEQNRIALVEATVAQALRSSPCSVFHLAQLGRQSAPAKSDASKPTQPTGE